MPFHLHSLLSLTHPPSLAHALDYIAAPAHILPLSAAALLALFLARWYTSPPNLPHHPPAPPSSSTPSASLLRTMFSIINPRPTPLPASFIRSATTNNAPVFVSDSADIPIAAPEPLPPFVHQPFDAFLVLDVEATCLQGTDFQWPNEIIVRPLA